MDDKENLMRQLKSFKGRAAKALGAVRIVLFGSVAEGTDNADSDIDIIVVSDKFQGMDFFKRTALVYGYWDIRRPVDFLCYTPKEFDEQSKGVTIASHARKYGAAI